MNNNTLNQENTLDARYQYMIARLEEQIKNNEFKTKEELLNLINSYPKEKFANYLTADKIKELLDLYDQMHKSEEEPSLNMQNYKEASLENQNLIVSKDDSILKTEAQKGEALTEFKSIQNELTSQGKGTEAALANADDVYKEMQNNRKVEVKLVPITEAINLPNIDIEILNKIRFFITNTYVNPYSYKVSVEDGIFYNSETNEVLEVRKNEQTGKYEIYKAGGVVYSEDNTANETMQDEMKTEERDLEREKPKVRKLVPEQPHNQNNAAFVKNTFIVFGICIISVIIAIAIILIQK